MLNVGELKPQQSDNQAWAALDSRVSDSMFKNSFQG